MCFGSGDNGAAAAAQQQTQMLEAQQAKHDADVAAGKTSIDNAFAQFDQPYFDKYGQSYKDVYNPQLTDQYGIAKDKLYAKLAGNDQLGGSTGNNTLAQLDKVYANGQTDIANKASDNENAFKASVDSSKSNLYGLNAAAADPETMATNAQATAGAIVAPQSYPNLSDIFGGVLSGVATASKANANSMNPSSFFGNSSGNGIPISGNGSAVFG
jgi:hypothetical protein